jgi:hypothetical protein
MPIRSFCFIGVIAACMLLSACALVESVARATKSVCGIQDPPPSMSKSFAPQNEWEATWKGERDDTLKQLRFGRGAE